MIDVIMKVLGILILFSGACVMWQGDVKGRIGRLLLYSLLMYLLITYRPIHIDPDDGHYPDITEYSPE